MERKGVVVMDNKVKEVLTGVLIGIIITIAFAIKVIAAPISAEDEELLIRTVQAEAGNQNLTGRRLVAAVILNRVENAEFPDSVKGVLSQKGQFATYGKLSSARSTWKDELAVQMEMEERINRSVLFFSCGNYIPNTSELMKYGDHYFSTLYE